MNQKRTLTILLVLFLATTIGNAMGHPPDSPEKKPIQNPENLNGLNVPPKPESTPSVDLGENIKMVPATKNDELDNDVGETPSPAVPNRTGEIETEPLLPR